MTQPSGFLPFQVLLLCLTGVVGEIIVVEGIMVVEALMVAEAIMVEGATMVVGATIVAEVIRNPTIPSAPSTVGKLIESMNVIVLWKSD